MLYGDAGSNLFRLLGIAAIHPEKDFGERELFLIEPKWAPNDTNDQNDGPHPGS